MTLGDRRPVPEPRRWGPRPSLRATRRFSTLARPSIAPGSSGTSLATSGCGVFASRPRRRSWFARSSRCGGLMPAVVSASPAGPANPPSENPCRRGGARAGQTPPCRCTPQTRYLELETRKDGIKFTNKPMRAAAEQLQALTSDYDSRQAALVAQVGPGGVVGEGGSRTRADPALRLVWSSTPSPTARPMERAPTRGHPERRWCRWRPRFAGCGSARARCWPSWTCCLRSLRWRSLLPDLTSSLNCSHPMVRHLGPAFCVCVWEWLVGGEGRGMIGNGGEPGRALGRGAWLGRGDPSVIRRSSWHTPFHRHQHAPRSERAGPTGLPAPVRGAAAGRGIHPERLRDGQGDLLVPDHHRAKHGRQVHLHPPGELPAGVGCSGGRGTIVAPCLKAECSARGV